ncbi:hypothetical protein TNCV_820551 [Trichonephila clavipes]|nr:hypothetical protein TNCV_820551 [Trichonephila clavipes]
MLRAHRTEGRGFCPLDKRATSLPTLVEIRKGNLLSCRSANYPQKERPKTRQIHLTQVLLQLTTRINNIVRSPIDRLAGGEVCSSIIYTSRQQP